MATTSLTHLAPAAAVLHLDLSSTNGKPQDRVDFVLSRLQSAKHDPEVGVIVISGAENLNLGKADIRGDSGLEFGGAKHRDYLQDLCEGLQACSKPVIAAVASSALGGGFDVILMCDMIFASSAAQFGFPDVKLGLMPRSCSMRRIAAVLGPYRAIWRMSAILLGKPVSAAEAKAIGLVTDVFATDEVVSHTLEVALTLASVSFASWCLAKTVVARDPTAAAVTRKHARAVTCRNDVGNAGHVVSSARPKKLPSISNVIPKYEMPCAVEALSSLSTLGHVFPHMASGPSTLSHVFPHMATTAAS